MIRSQAPFAAVRSREERRSGVAMIVVLTLIVALLFIAAASVELSIGRARAAETTEQVFAANQVAESGAAQALTFIKQGGVNAPFSGAGAAAAWVDFSEGQFFYRTDVDVATQSSVIKAWGRVAAVVSPSNSAVAPDDPTFDGTGWVLQGLELTVKTSRYVPPAPAYFGNGGIEEPLGGLSSEGGFDPSDPSTWVPVTSSPLSYQASWVPMEVNALDHPADYLQSGTAP